LGTFGYGKVGKRGRPTRTTDTYITQAGSNPYRQPTDTLRFMSGRSRCSNEAFVDRGLVARSGRPSGAGPCGADLAALEVRAGINAVRRRAGRPSDLAQIDVDVLDLRVRLEGVHAVLAAHAGHLVATERASAWTLELQLTEITPDWMPFAVRIAFAMSRVQMEPERP